MNNILDRLAGVSRSGEGWSARCPAHEDRQNSLSIRHQDGRWLVNCHAGCSWQDILAALNLEASALFEDGAGGGGLLIPRNNGATAQPSSHLRGSTPAEGLTLEQYSVAKALPVDFLKSCGISEFTYEHKSALRIPYLGAAGEELAVRFRIGLDGDRFRWK